jgi:myo-inositol 2-dehydrogenase/D-chiro-inositol 1-dehydrogenase
MSMTPTDPVSRRDFVKTTAAISASLAIPSYAYAFGSDVIKVGLIGCGGRGTGGIVQNIQSSEGMELIALGDLLPERLERAKQEITRAAANDPKVAAGYKVKDDHCFTGFDAYKKVLATDVQIVMLATPPGLRPLHLRASIEAGKHVFAEKPVATDVAGIKSVLETYNLAMQKGLGIGVGTQRRHHPGYQEMLKRIQDGAIGDVLNGQVYWNQAGLWSFKKDPAWSDMEWQLRDWLYFTWLSGDHIVEQHVHNLDVANWVMGGPPIRATGMGGRQTRVAPEFGHIYDHFAVDYEYANGVHINSMCRQIIGSRGRVGEWFQGSKGTAQSGETGPIVIKGANAWEWQRPTGFVQPMVQEHTDLVSSIRAGKPRNDLKRMADSVLTAIAGRESAYTGQTIEWAALLNSTQNIAPMPLDAIKFGPVETPPVAMPGRTKLDRKFIEGW